MLSDVIEKHSQKKKVSLLIHDFGSINGMNLAMDRPDLVTRIATLDIAGQFDSSAGWKIYSWSY